MKMTKKGFTAYLGVKINSLKIMEENILDISGGEPEGIYLSIVKDIIQLRISIREAIRQLNGEDNDTT